MTSTGLRFAARSLPLADATPGLLAEWAALAARAIEGNAFLAPWFLRPAACWLDPSLRIELLIVEACGPAGQRALTGLLPVHRSPATRSLPVRHLAVYRAVHGYATGALVDAAHADDTLRCLLQALPGLAADCGALRLQNLRCDGPLRARAQPLLAECGHRWFATRQASRAALVLAAEATGPGPHPTPAASADAGAGAGAGAGAAAAAAATMQPKKTMRRSLDRLAEMAGRVEFRVLRGTDITDAAIERHLALEHAGWKGAAGGAMLAHPAHATFFRETARGAAAAGSAFFCELVAGECVVASTSNFVAGLEGFAFKLGWEPRFARCSPGLLVDDALRRHARQAWPGLRTLDGCADPGSHLERIWDGRISVADGYLAWGRRERAVLGAIEALRPLLNAAGGRPRQA